MANVPAIDVEKAKEILNSLTSQAQELLKNTSKLEEVLQQMEQKLKEIPKVGDALSRVPLMISMIRSYITKEYSVGAPKVIITLIAMFLRNFADLPVVIHAFAGIRACVCVLILNAVLKLWKSTVIDLPTGVIFTAVFLISVLLGLPPALIVIVAGLVGLGLKRARGWET